MPYPKRRSYKTIDLENVPNPAGRVDVLLYGIAKNYIKAHETKTGMEGLFETVKPHIQEVINKGLGGFVIPPEASLLLTMAQMHMANQSKLREEMDKQNANTL